MSDDRDQRQAGTTLLPQPMEHVVTDPMVAKYGPVVKSWKIFMNATPDKHVMVLRYPERMPGNLYTTRNGQKPLEMRIKTNFNLVEIDIPLDPHNDSYDKIRGIIYGEAMRKSSILKEKGGSFGVAGGFALGGVTQKRGNARTGQTAEGQEPTVEELLANYDSAVENGHVMNKITVGGHIIPRDENSPNYFVGAFRGSDVFFTKVDAICVLRPQLVHLDALNEQKKVSLRMQPGADTEQNEAVSINMTIRKSEGESMESAGDSGEIAKLLKAMRDEPWQRMGWVDCEEDDSYDIFNETFVRKNPEVMPRLACSMTNEQWLDVISCPRIDPINPNQRPMTTRVGDDDLSSTDSEGDNEQYTGSEDEDVEYFNVGDEHLENDKEAPGGAANGGDSEEARKGRED